MELEKHHRSEIPSLPRPATDVAQRKASQSNRLRKTLVRSIGFLLLFTIYIVIRPNYQHNLGEPDRIHHRLTAEQAEKLFLSVPSTESALAASRDYATHPHLAGSAEDFGDAKTILELIQDEWGIPPPKKTPIFAAGSRQSRFATLRLTGHLAPKRPMAWVDTYYPVMNTPLNRSLEILDTDGSVLWNADLVEDGDPRDEEAAKFKDAVPTWHGLSFDGIATGQLVYANYGTQEDYSELVSQGVDLNGKVVITRYGGIFRGLKIKGAQELGAAGVLIYSDPRDDGFVTVQNGYAAYPAGPARNPSSVQRGSVQYLSLYPGDPTTPGYPAYENADRKEGVNIPKIPSLPISWNNAQRLLGEIGDIYLDQVDATSKRRLSGQTSKRMIKLVNHVDTKVTPIWNTMAAIPGHIKDEVVLIGCHRDAWVMGAADPTSGTVSLHEIIRGFGTLLKKGWRPLRTVVIASWDAEEYGLIGSTEWGEDFHSWISEHVVAYLNVDVSVSGSRWNAGGTPSLAHLIKQAALEVPHPHTTGKTLWDARDDEGPFKVAGNDNQNRTVIDEEYMKAYEKDQQKRKAFKTDVHPLGSGSDYTVFLQRIGVASSDEGFGYTASDAVYHYHSIYDSQRWQETYADPGFQRHVAVAQHLGLIGLRLIDSIILPLNTTQYSLELDDYLDRVETLIPDLKLNGDTPDFSALRRSIKQLQETSFKLDEEKVEAEKTFRKLLERLPFPRRRHPRCKGKGGFRRRVADWVKRVLGITPSVHQENRQPTHLRFDSWQEFLSLDLEKHLNEAYPHKLPFPIHKFLKAAKRVSKANKKLIAFERGFISEEGIKDREWYKHLGVAPGKWLGYGATTFPALTESLSIEKNASLAKYEASRLVELLDTLAERIHP